MYHRTAIARRAPSAPARLLESRGLLKGRVLDYGAGRGADAAAFGLEAYEPNGGPAMPEGRFDTVLCTFVLNVVDSETGASVLSDIRTRLTDDGTAYVTVRRDVRREPEGYRTSTGTFQRWVELDAPVLIERRGCFCTYVIRKDA